MQDILIALGQSLLILTMISSGLGLLLAIVGKLSKKNNLCKIARRMSIVAIVSSATVSAIAAYLPTLNTKSRSFSVDWSPMIILLAIVLGAALITLLISKGVKKGEETVEQSASVPASAASIKQQEMPTPEQSESKDRAMLIPKSLLVIAILNVLIRLYDGLGYLEIIEIALIAAALYLVLKGKKSIANICGILVPVLEVLGSVQALPYIAYWPVPTTIAFLATLILSVLFTIATLKAKPQQKATPVQTAPMQAVTSLRENLTSGNTWEGQEKERFTSFDSAYCDMGKHILLLFLTFGVWYYIWIYRMTGYLNAVEDEEYRDPTKKLLLCIFVPFYAVYWIYKSAQRVDKLAAQKGVTSELSTLCLVLALFVGVVPPILIQDKVNAIIKHKPVATNPNTEATVDAQPVPETSKADGQIELLEKLAKLHEQGILTDEEFKQKKADLLAKM